MLPDVKVYFEIFNDYMDFDIYPWHENGFDHGKMYLERKSAMRYLKMGIAMYDSGNLEENILNVIQPYIPEKYQLPESHRPQWGKKQKKLKQQQQQHGGNMDQAINDVVNQKIKERFGGLPGVTGIRVQDMVESKTTKATGKDRYVETTTRTVNWDVPGEDSLNPTSWNWKAYATDGELENYDKDLKREKKRRREEKKSLR